MARLFRLSRHIWCFLGILAMTWGVYGQMDIGATGTWSDTQDAGDLLAGAGSDLNSTSESAANAVLITITAPVGNWRVDVGRDNTSWNVNLHLWCQRTGDGTGGSVAGGSSYQEITTSDVEFFTGTGEPASIPVQFKITGISIQVPIGIYSTIITFTLTDGV